MSSNLARRVPSSPNSPGSTSNDIRNRTTFLPAGTSSIVHEITHQPLLSTLSAIVETVVRLRNHGHRVVLVSSGAIGVGLKRMEIPSRPKSLAKKQVSPAALLGTPLSELTVELRRL